MDPFIFSKLQDSLRLRGIRTLTADPQNMIFANHKAKTLFLCKKLSIPHPEFYIVKNEKELREAAKKLSYPKKRITIKPPYSEGARGFRIIREKKESLNSFLTMPPSSEEISLDSLLEILNTSKKWPEFILSEYLPGKEYSVDAFIGKKHEIAIGRLRKKVSHGISYEAIIDPREDIQKRTLILGRELKLNTLFGCQFRCDENNVPKFLECNPRLQSTMIATYFSGINLLFLAIAETLEIDHPPLSKIKPASFYRFWSGISVKEDESREEIRLEIRN